MIVFSQKSEWHQGSMLNIQTDFNSDVVSILSPISCYFYLFSIPA